MNHIKENQKIKIIPDNISEISTGVIISVNHEGFVAQIENSSAKPSLLSIGQNPEILISLDNCMILFTAEISKIENENDNVKVFFSGMSKITFVQKREYPRVKTNVPVFLTTASCPQNVLEQGTIINIGGGGMSIVSPMEVNSKCFLKASFKLSGKKEINTVFEVLRVASENNADNKKFLISGKFGEISNFDKTSIIQFCFKHQLELKCRR